MKVIVKTRYMTTSETIMSSAECNTIEDLVEITKSLVTASEAYLNDLRVVKDGFVEMFMYNFKEEVVLYLNGSTKELNARLNKDDD